MVIIDTSKIACCDHYGRRFECINCGLDVEEDCTCFIDDDIDELTVHCHSCGTVTEDVPVSDFVFIDDEDIHYDDWGDETPPLDIKRSIYYSKCRHYNKPVEFPDGVTVYASSLHDRDIVDESPDFGLYLDTTWDPTTIAYTLHWPDFNIPPVLHTAAYTIVDVYNKARKGLWIEVGCIGGHGRTGTVLACMAVLSGMPWKDAIKWVRNTYCGEAIETIEQEWMVSWFDAFVNGGESPSEPIWDSDKKKYTNGPIYNYDEGLAWRDYDPCDFPKGGPSNPNPERWDHKKWFEREVTDDYELKDGEIEVPF